MSKLVINELLQGKQKALQLQSLLRDLSSIDDRLVDGSIASLLINEVLGSFTMAISGLESDSGLATVGSRVETITIPNSEEQVSENSSKKRKNSMPRRSGYRRRSDPYTSRIVMSKTMEDAFSWRKYGQKDIFDAKYPRHYFRCTHKYDEGCQATRQVQKNNEEIYEITYMGEHTCTNINHHQQQNNGFIINFEAKTNDHKINEPLSLTNPPLKQELSPDDEVISCLTPPTSSSQLFFSEFPQLDDDGLPNFDALEQCDVTSSFHHFSGESFFSDHLLSNYEF